MNDLEKELADRDQKVAELESKIADLVKENDRLRDLLEGKAEAKSSRKPRFSDNYRRQRFANFTRNDLLDEVQKWIKAGQSIFEEELDRMKQANVPPVSP